MNYKGNNKFGVLPRRTMIANQPHMLAYINPQEEMLLRQLGGAGEPVGPMEIPAYYFGMGGQEQPSENFGYDAPGDRGGGGNQGVSANDYNAAISRVNQPFERGYNQNSRNRDLATIDAYNASFTPVNDPSEIATPTISSPVSDDSFLGVSDGGSGYVDSGTVDSAGVTGTGFDFGMGSTDGVGSSAGDSSSSEITVDPANTSGATTTSIVGTDMFDNIRNLMAQEEAGAGASAGVTGANFDFGMGSVDGVSNVGTGDIGSGGVDFDSGGDFLGEFGGSGVDLGGGVSAPAPENDFDFGAGSIDGVGSSAGEGDVGITIDPYDNPYAIDITDTNIYTENPDGTYTIEDGEPDPIEMGGDGEGEPPANEPDNVTTTTDTLPSSFNRVEYNFDTSLDPSQYGGMWSNITSTIPKYEFNAYEDEDGLLRFSENDELVPEDILKYMPYAKKTLVEEETEETETEEE